MKILGRKKQAFRDCWFITLFWKNKPMGKKIIKICLLRWDTWSDGEYQLQSQTCPTCCFISRSGCGSDPSVTAALAKPPVEHLKKIKKGRGRWWRCLLMLNPALGWFLKLGLCFGSPTSNLHQPILGLACSSGELCSARGHWEQGKARLDARAGCWPFSLLREIPRVCRDEKPARVSCAHVGAGTSGVLASGGAQPPPSHPEQWVNCR